MLTLLEQSLSFPLTDVDGIKFVINYDYPNSSEDYIHRIGRTGRCTSLGTSYAFFTAKDCKQAKDLVSVLREANQTINPKLEELAQFGGSSGRSKFLIKMVRDSHKTNWDASSNLFSGYHMWICVVLLQICRCCSGSPTGAKHRILPENGHSHNLLAHAGAVEVGAAAERTTMGAVIAPDQDSIIEGDLF
ncbi:unnamed protein product [Timema podura]|uniref:Helicase C-terminal domain-containing protein n=1 Tax=Timema podura TaxID=61482 RepID=A0ABN7NQJ0_TIMPD|nr:unnamed protein product [Timema podura]